MNDVQEQNGTQNPDDVQKQISMQEQTGSLEQNGTQNPDNVQKQISVQEQNGTQKQNGAQTADLAAAAAGKNERLPMLLLSAAEASSVLFFCTKSSPLYPFNDWTDANCFFTVGKAILNGQVLYRDIAEQKGLLLYLLHALASLISSGTFLGVFVLEAVAGTFTLYGFHRILQKSCGKLSFVLAPFAGLLLYTAAVFSHGDSTEELCTPLLLYCLYISMEAVADDRRITGREWFLTGISAACIFWMKYSLCTMFAGMVLVPLFLQIRRRKTESVLQGIGRAVGFGLAGFLTVTVPVLLYFAVHGALQDLWDIYFYDNLFRYSAGIAAGQGMGRPGGPAAAGHGPVLLQTVATGLRKNRLWLLFTAAGLLHFILKKDRKGGLHFLLLFVTAAVPAYAIGKRYPYYYFATGLFTVYGFCLAGDLLQRLRLPQTAKAFGRPFSGRKMRAGATAAAAVLCALLACRFSPNRYYRTYSKENIPQFVFADIIDTVPGATLLNYGFLDSGFYTAAGIVPNCRFFCRLNSSIPGMTEAQDAYVREAVTDFVVTRGNRLKASGYTLVSTAETVYENKKMTYYLYQANRRLTAGQTG